MVSPRIEPFEYGNADDDGIAEQTQQIGRLIQKEESEQRGEQDNGVIVDGNLLGRRFCIGSRNKKLSARSRHARKNEGNELERSHGVVVENKRGRKHDAGKEREEENDKRALHACRGRLSEKGIGKPCAESAEQSRDRRDRLHGERRFHDEKRADKRYGDCNPVEFGRAFFQGKVGKDDRKERGQLVQNGRVRNGQMTDRVKIAHDACRSRNRTHENVFHAPFRKHKVALIFHEKEKGEEYGDGVSEKRLLHRRHVPGKFDE